MHAWHATWRVHVVPVFSRAGEGYVQHRFMRHAAEDGHAVQAAEHAGDGAPVPPHTAALVCGHYDMTRELETLLRSRGVHRLLTNY